MNKDKEAKQYKTRVADKAIRKDAVQDKSVGKASVPNKAGDRATSH